MVGLKTGTASRGSGLRKKRRATATVDSQTIEDGAISASQRGVDHAGHEISSDESDKDREDDLDQVRGEKDDVDPIVSEYDVYLTETGLDSTHLFQYPNRDAKQPYTLKNYAKPNEVRIKQSASLVELDIPMNVFDNYDKDKALQWGQALERTSLDKAGGSHGLAGGFGIGGTLAGVVRSTINDVESGRKDFTAQMLRSNFVEANSNGHVLNKQVLGGQVNPVGERQSGHMVGVFRDRRYFHTPLILEVGLLIQRKDQFHLSRIDTNVQLRPQFHHLDASTEQERQTVRQQQQQQSQAMGSRQPDSRAVQMTAKAADGEDIDMARTTQTLKAAQDEIWASLDYADEKKSNEAWEAYERLFASSREKSSTLHSASAGTDYVNDTTALQASATPAGEKAPLVKSETHAVDNKAESSVPSKRTKSVLKSTF
ncbi:MAG: hypothetical protein M1825_004397 [Sarcosagium campestre]|nr:MAG: hypothetical protein M1825_004397 [Sarcosagium campestre]